MIKVYGLDILFSFIWLFEIIVTFSWLVFFLSYQSLMNEKSLECGILTFMKTYQIHLWLLPSNQYLSSISNCFKSRMKFSKKKTEELVFILNEWLKSESYWNMNDKPFKIYVNLLYALKILTDSFLLK